MVLFSRAVPKYNKDKSELFIDPEFLEPRKYNLSGEEFFVQPFLFGGLLVPLTELCKGKYYESTNPEASKKGIKSIAISTVLVKVRDSVVAMDFHKVKPVKVDPATSADYTATFSSVLVVDTPCAQTGFDVQKKHTVKVTVDVYPLGIRAKCEISDVTNSAAVIKPIGYEVEAHYDMNDLDFFEAFTPKPSTAGVYMVVNPFIGETDYGSIRGMIVAASSVEEAINTRPHHFGAIEPADASSWPGRPDQMLVRRLGSNSCPHGIYMVDEIGS